MRRKTGLLLLRISGYFRRFKGKTFRLTQNTRVDALHENSPPLNKKIPAEKNFSCRLKFIRKIRGWQLFADSLIEGVNRRAQARFDAHCQIFHFERNIAVVAHHAAHREKFFPPLPPQNEPTAAPTNNAETTMPS